MDADHPSMGVNFACRFTLQWPWAVFAGDRSLIPAVGADFLDEGEPVDKPLTRERQTVAIL